jgi:hypothetical protein
MQQVLARIEAEVPGARRAQDSPGARPTSPSTTANSPSCHQAAIDRVRAHMRAAGMNATVSSIHINGWFGAHNKLEGARWIVRQLYGRALDAELSAGSTLATPPTTS